jgi:hypothetical protein
MHLLNRLSRNIYLYGRAGLAFIIFLGFARSAFANNNQANKDDGGPLQVSRVELVSRGYIDGSVDRSNDTDEVFERMDRDLNGKFDPIIRDLISNKIIRDRSGNTIYYQPLHFRNAKYFGNISIVGFQQDGFYVYAITTYSYPIEQKIYQISWQRFLCATDPGVEHLSPCGNRLKSRPLRDGRGLSGPRLVRDEYKTAIDEALFRISTYWLDKTYDRNSVTDIQVAERDSNGAIVKLKGKAKFENGTQQDYFWANWGKNAVTCISFLYAKSSECYSMPTQSTREALLEVRKSWEAPKLKASADKQALRDCAQNQGAVFGPGYLKKVPGVLVGETRTVLMNGELEGYKYKNVCQFTIIMISNQFGRADTRQELKAGQTVQSRYLMRDVEKK